MSLYPALAALVAVIALVETRSWFSPEPSLFSQHLPPVAVTCLVLLVLHFFAPVRALIALCLLASVTLLWQAAAPSTPDSIVAAVCIGWLANELYGRATSWQVISTRLDLHVPMPALAAGLVLWLLPRSAVARLRATAGFALWSVTSTVVFSTFGGAAVERDLITACDRTWSVVAVVCGIDFLVTLCRHAWMLCQNPQYTMRLTSKHVLEHNE